MKINEMSDRRILYSRWYAMQRRCYDPNKKNFKSYGGRGIEVCFEWLKSFDAFHDWAIENGFKPDLQIHRIDSDAGYGPDNCRLLTAEQHADQHRSKKRRHKSNMTPKYTLADLRKLRGHADHEELTREEQLEQLESRRAFFADLQARQRSESAIRRWDKKNLATRNRKRKAKPAKTYLK